MKFICSLIISLLVALVSANVSLAGQWRGVIPLHSTRADVERLLGVPQQSTPYASYYSLPDEIAVVWFQLQSCDSDVFGLGWDVPIGTVTGIGVIPKKNYGKEKFVNGSGFKVYAANAGFSYYTDESEGLSIETFNGIVTSLDYTPAKTEDGRRCPRIQECCVDFFPRFDEYRNLTFEDEKARLDNYAFAMKERLNRGVMIIYGKNRTERRKGMRRAEQAKNYLWRKHAIEARRILIVDGGYSERSMTQLNLHSIGGLAGRVYLFPENDPEERNKKRR